MRKKLIYSLLGFFILIFLLFNFIAYNHAYKFTHYVNTNQPMLPVYDTSSISISKKIKFMLNGIDVPRPLNTITPSFKYKNINLKTKEGSIELWLSEKVNTNGTIILFHGYANKKSSLITRADEFLKLNYNVVLVDFLGSGGSDGNKNTVGYFEAEQVKTCFDFVQEKGEKNIYLFGISMGAVAIMKCMNDYKLDVKGILLECPFGYMKTTIEKRFKNFGAPTFPLVDLLMLWGSYHGGFWTYNHNPVYYAKKITCPTLLLHGEKDHAVSKKEITNIYNNLQGKKMLKTFENTGHAIFTAITKFTWIEVVNTFLIETRNLNKTQ